jgi:hypothetical protein
MPTQRCTEANFEVGAGARSVLWGLVIPETAQSAAIRNLEIPGSRFARPE